jgi:uncharacterized protein
MHKQIFVNLPVANLALSQAFFKKLGYEFNPQFSNEKGACLVLGENLFAMLLTRDFFQTFTDKAVADAHHSSQVVLCLDCESRAALDALMAKAVAAGAKTPRAPLDHGFVYVASFEDLDGHAWELMHMAPAEPKA